MYHTIITINTHKIPAIVDDGLPRNRKAQRGTIMGSFKSRLYATECYGNHSLRAHGPGKENPLVNIVYDLGNSRVIAKLKHHNFKAYSSSLNRLK